MKVINKCILITAGIGLLLLTAPAFAGQNSNSDSTGSAKSSDPAAARPVKMRPAKKQEKTATILAEMNDPSTSAASSSATTPGPAGTPGTGTGQSSPAPAPSAPATPAAAPAAPAAAASVFDSVAINGFIDGYYSYDFQHPHAVAGSVPAGTAGLPSVAGGTTSSELAAFRAFDAPQSTLMLNMIELTMTKTPAATDRLGFDLTLGAGNAMNVVNSTEPGGLGYARYIKEAYVSYLAPVGKGLEFDFGKFVTAMGQEVIETNANWNYSRSLLFTYSIPYYHFGLRAKYVFNDKYTLTGYLVNGWNDIVDNNTGKSGMVTFAWTATKKISWTQSYMAGPEMPGTNTHWRQTYDTEVGYNPTAKLSLAVNGDYGRGDEPAGFTSPVWWGGAAGYVRYSFNANYAFTTRYEYYDDHNGFTTGGTPQDLNEVTLTFERIVGKNLITRWEYRRDMSNKATLFRGSTPVKNQNTLALGLVYTFDIHDAH